MKNTPIIFIILLTLQIVSPTPFCSAFCSYSFNGIYFTPACIDYTPTTCTKCDSPLFQFSITTCLFDITNYTNQIVDLSPPDLSTWNINPNAVINSVSVNTINTDYIVAEFSASTFISKLFALTQIHYALKLRMFIILVNNPSYDLSIIVDGNTQNPLKVQNSSRTFLTTIGFDSYIFTSDDISHTENSVLINIDINNFNPNGAGTFGIKQFMIFSKRCLPQCLTCTEYNKCQSCTTISTTVGTTTTYTIYYLSNNFCLTYCQQGFYIDTIKPNNCLSCNPNCKSCEILSTNCTSCNIHNLNFSFLFNFTCISACPASTYMTIQKICLKCHIGCFICSNNTNNFCFSCANDSNGISYYLHAEGFTCDLSCPLKQYANDTNSCDFCNPLCQICDSTPNKCLSCVKQGQYISYFYQLNYSCLQNCPNNYIIQITNNSCVCPVRFYIGLYGNCLKCSIFCKKCFGTTMNECQQCVNGFFLIYNHTTCISSCPNGQFPSLQLNQCFLCSQSCYICSQNAQNCTGCNNNTYLLNNKCFNLCPQGYQTARSPNICLRCLQGTYSSNQICVKICPTGYIKSNITQSCILQNQYNPKVYYFNFTTGFVNDGKKMSHILHFPSALQNLSKPDFYDVKIMVIDYDNELQQILKLQNMHINKQLTEIILYTNLPNNIDNYINLKIQIVFSNRSLLSADKILYGSFNSFYPLNHPSFINKIYTDHYFSSYDYIGYVFSIISIISLYICYWNKYAYNSCLQYLMLIQTLKLYSYIKYPVEFDVYAFLRGFRYSQQQIIPNIFNFIFPFYYKQNSLECFEFSNIDMNFLRISGSCFVLIIIIQVPLLYFYFYDKDSFKKVILWIERLLMHFISVTIIFGWSASTISLFKNLDKKQFLFIFSQMLSCVSIGFLIYYYYKNQKLNSQTLEDSSQQTSDISNKILKSQKYTFIGIFSNCIILPFLNIQFSLFFLGNNILQLILILYYFQKYQNLKSTRGFNKCIYMVSSILIFNIIFLSQISSFTIISVTVLLIINLILKIKDVYYGFTYQFTQKINDRSKQNQSQFTKIQSTIYTEYQPKQSAINQTQLQFFPNNIILERSLQQSPKRDKNTSQSKQLNQKNLKRFGTLQNWRLQAQSIISKGGQSNEQWSVKLKKNQKQMRETIYFREQQS